MQVDAIQPTPTMRGDPIETRLRTLAGEVVGATFYGTLLQTMRDSHLRTPLGHGGRGEEVFGAQLHALYAQRLGTTESGGLGQILFDALKAQATRVHAQDASKETVQ